MAIYTEGIMADGACILKDGAKMTIDDVLSELNAAAGNVTCDANLERLVRRFEAMAKVREDHALELRMARNEEKDRYAAICGMESAASAYRRCAEEVHRVANGETPTEPNERWD